MTGSLNGLAASGGRATGPAYRMASVPALPPPAAVSDVEAESAHALKALTAVAEELNQRSSSVTDPAAQGILRAQAMMADDRQLRTAVDSGVRAGSDAVHAIDAAFAEHLEIFQAAGGFLAERVADLRDIRNRAVAACLGRPMPGIPSPGHPFVLLAYDLAPADTAGLDPDQVLAIVTEVGGPTSHTAILARALGLPAVVNCPQAVSIADGTYVTVDGTTGIVETGVPPSVAPKTQIRSLSTGPGHTADGHPVALLANVGSARDIEALDENVEGIGLFRTELLYLDRAEAPGRDEQIALYTKLFGKLAGRRVVVRTLDAGADKPLPFLTQPGEPNPALGVRGLRVSWRQPEVLTTQLEAIAAAASAASAQVWVMAPMVATPAEAAAFAARCHDTGLRKVGVMVEIPSAAIQAQRLVQEVDFLSIGTNDLSQYTFAADRQSGELAELLDPWQPALLHLIAGCATAGERAGKPVGVCGEAAADPALAVVLAGLGISSLSMSARAIPAVREALAARTLADCRRIAEAVLATDNPAAARAAAALPSSP